MIDLFRWCILFLRERLFIFIKILEGEFVLARLSSEDRERILADFHTGTFSQRELAKKYGVSPATINKITKNLTPKNEHIVNTKVSLITELIEQSEHEVNAVEEAVHQQTKHLIFFQNSALKNQELANQQLSEESELYDLKLHADLTSKNKQTVLGKDADTNININNNQQNNINEVKVTFLED